MLPKSFGIAKGWPIGSGQTVATLPVAPTLGTLSLSSTNFTITGTSSANIIGATAGSTITATSSDGTALAVNARTLSGTFTAVGSPSITLTETLAGATGSPKSTVVPVAVTASSLAKMGQVGFNLAPDNSQGSPTFMFLDRMKSSSYNGLWDKNPPVSTYGYPTGAPNGAPLTTVALRTPETGTIRHVLRHNGVGLTWNFNFVNNITIVDASNPNRVIFDVAPRISGQGFPALQLSSATTWPDYKPGNPPETRDGIAIYELEHEAAYLAGELFHPVALESYKRYWSIRFMDAMKTNGSTATLPTDRHPVGYVSYKSGTWGMPLEAMVALCNKTGAHLWYTVPHLANDDYLTWAFSYIRDNLNAGLLCIVEYSNEVWNTDFAQSGYANTFAKTINSAWNQNHGYGYLAAKVIKKAREVFGAQSSRVFGVFARQTAFILASTQAATGLEAFEGKKVRDYFSAVAQGFYDGGGGQSLVSSSSTAQQKQYMLDEVARYEATGADFATRTVRQELVDQMFTGNVVPGWGTNVDTLSNLTLHLQDAADFAKAQGVPHMIGYEGQAFHVNAFALGATDGLRVVTMFKAMANDPRISSTAPTSYLSQKFAMMRGKGMTGHNVFMDYSPITQFGLWGTKDHAFSPDNLIWNFYKYYGETAPDQVAFSFVKPATTVALTTGDTANIPFPVFGGLAPASAPVLESGSLPAGTTLVNGAVVGLVTNASSGTFTLSATDASGRKVVSPSYTINVVAQTGFRYFRITAKRSLSQDSSNTFYRVGAGEVVFKNGSTAIPSTGFTATADVASANGAQRSVDGNISTDYISDQGQNSTPLVGRITIDTGAGAGIRPTSMDVYQVSVQATFSMSGFFVEASMSGATWVTIADTAHPSTYTSGFTNVPFTLPA